MSSIDATTLIHEGWNHLQLNRPLAARASWQRALRVSPDDPAATDALERLESAAELPASARAVYRFQTPGDDTRRVRWDRYLRVGGLEDLESAEAAFASIVRDDPSDHVAWLNRAFCLAWLGRNAEAVAALEHVVRLQAEPDPVRASDAWTLAEVLRLGAGAEPLADDVRYAWTLAWKDAALAPEDLFEHWPNLRPVAIPADVQALAKNKVFEWLDRPVAEDADPTTARAENLPRVIAAVIATPQLLRLSSPDPTGFAVLDDDPRYTALANVLTPARRERSPLELDYADAALGTFRLPADLDPEARASLSREVVEYFYEHHWIHLPRIGLDGLSPRDAARRAAQGDAAIRAKLAGVVRFREQLGSRPHVLPVYQGYPFDRLRRRLGLVDPAECAGTLDPADVSCMSEAELNGLDASSLDPSRLADAFRSATAFRDDPLTIRFASEILKREPVALNGVDPTALFGPIVREAMQSGEPARALETLRHARALVSDLRSRLVLATWSAEILSRAGEPERAASAYRAILDEPGVPDPAALALDAAETLLDNDQPEHAIPFLIEARDRAISTGDRATRDRAEALRKRYQP